MRLGLAFILFALFTGCSSWNSKDDFKKWELYSIATEKGISADYPKAAKASGHFSFPITQASSFEEAESYLDGDEADLLTTLHQMKSITIKSSDAKAAPEHPNQYPDIICQEFPHHPSGFKIVGISETILVLELPALFSFNQAIDVGVRERYAFWGTYQLIYKPEKKNP